MNGSRAHATPPPATARACSVGVSLLRSIALAAPVGLLTACAAVDPLMRETCLAVLPALESSEARLRVEEVAAGPRPGTVVVTYRALDGAGEGRAETLACAFGDELGNGDTRALLGVRTASGPLSGARLALLKRWWLEKIDARAEGLARLDFADAARPRGLLTLGPDAALRLQQAIDAAAPCALYALLGLACSLIYGLIGRINVAFGEMAMLGGFAAVIGVVAVETLGGAAVAPAIAVALTAALALGAGWGMALGRTVFAPLAFRAAQPVLVATIGLSIALQEFVARAQGVRDVFLPPLSSTPLLIADGPFTVLITPLRLGLVAASVAAIAAVLWIFPRTPLGRRWRAVADDPVMARLLGIDPVGVLVAAFVLAGALAGLAGAVSTLAWGTTSFHMGTVLGLKAVAAAVVGGMGSLPGAVLGGVLVGVVEAGWTAAFDGAWRDPAVFTLLVLTVLLRPSGLLGDPAALEEDRRVR